MLNAILDSRNWAAVPFHFWSCVFFVLGTIVGSFLNVCIHRMPLGQSIVSPPSHCPHCKYSIPWYLNIPLVTWLYLGAKCRKCGAPIAARYFLVELLTGVLFLGAWLKFGHVSVLLALTYAVLLAGMVAATFIDFEHFIIPDEITFGGMAVGFIASFVLPGLHGTNSVPASLKASLLGLGVGAGLIYAILRVGKLLFGRHRISLPENTRIVFGETAVHFPDKVVAYEELFYRKTDTISVQAWTVELVDRCYRNVPVRLSPSELRIDDEKLEPAGVPYLEVVCSEIVLPREAMGLGDVKFMGAIGAFLGWPAVIFSLVISSLIGSVVGLLLVVSKKRHLSSRLPYGPYIALAAAIWIFAGPDLIAWYQRLITRSLGYAG